MIHIMCVTNPASPAVCPLQAPSTTTYIADCAGEEPLQPPLRLLFLRLPDGSLALPALQLGHDA